MNRIVALVLGAAVAMVLFASTLTAQPQSTRIVFVDSQALIAAHPGGQAAAALQTQAQTELDEIRGQLDAIEAKARTGQQLTNDEAERFNILLTTFDTVQARYRADIANAATPAIQAVNSAIRTVATQNEYAVVFDIGAAAENGLVVFAADDLDITEMVLLQLGN
jgi:outer membrane protein